MSHINLINYAKSKNIFKLNSKINLDLKNFKNPYVLIKNHLDTINCLHTRLNGYKGNIPNTIGHSIDFINFNRKIFYNDIKNFKLNCKNDFENKIIKLYNIYSKKMEFSYSLIKKSNYQSLLNRAFINKELCIWTVGFKDMCMDNNGRIFIKMLENISSDIIENDYIKFLLKVKKIFPYVNTEDLIYYICQKENINQNSHNFMLGIINFPYGIIKAISKYKENGKHYGFKNFDMKYLEEAIKLDSIYFEDL